MKTIRIDQKTIILVSDQKDPDEARQKFIEGLTRFREKDTKSRITRPPA